MLPWNYRLPQKQLLAPHESPVKVMEELLWDVKVHGQVIEAATEADARAKMLIHLIEKGIVKL